MRIDLLEAFGLDPNVIAILKQKYGAQLLPIQERAFKEYQILNGGNFFLSAVTSSGKTLVASEICHNADEIKTFLKNTFTGRTLWDKQMTDADYACPLAALPGDPPVAALAAPGQ